MKKYGVLGVFLILALSIAVSFRPSSAAASDVESTTDIIFLSSLMSCYCDGMHLIYDVSQSANITGYRTGCANESFSTGKFVNESYNLIPPYGEGYGALISYYIGPPYNFNYYVTKLHFETQQWAHYAWPYHSGDEPLNYGNFAWGAICPFTPIEGNVSSIGR